MYVDQTLVPLTNCWQPNAKTDHIYYNDQTKIVIYAIRDIHPGEEISYDYMFAVDDDKVPCTCGAAKCKGFMNVD